MEIQKEREAFEDKFPVPAHWIDFDGLTCKYICKYNAIDDQALKYQARWEAWLAAKTQAVPEGFVVVPKEPTDKTIAHMINTPIEVNLLCDHADTFLSEGEAYIAYQAMIEAQEPTND